MNIKEINKKVYERYPVKGKESWCPYFKCRRDGLRNWYRKKLINEYSVTNVAKVGEH